MTITQLMILLPCYSLEDFQVSRSDEEAEEILAGLCGLFHPVLIQQTENVPRWERAYDPPIAPDQAMIVIPECSEKCLPSTWLADLPSGQSIVVRRYRNLAGLWDAIRHLTGQSLEVPHPELVDDFVALGYAYFQVELMTRQLRYMSNLDEVRFRNHTVKAAQALMGGDPDQAKENLQRSFDLLTESREYFYPVQTYLIDLTLTAETTLGPGLKRELEATKHVNLLTTGHLLRHMAEHYPETVQALKQSLEAGHVNVIGGEDDESPSAFLPQPALIRHLAYGHREWYETLGYRPEIFGKRRFGLTPLLPGILKNFRYEGVLHFALDDGQFPVPNQSKLRWEGLDEAVVEAVGRVPLDASRPSTFLKLGETVGRALDLDHAATVIFAHWPDKVSVWYKFLRRSAHYSPILGQFSLLRDYFRNTQYVGSRIAYKADEYRPPYLAQPVAESQINPIGRWIQFVRVCAHADVLANLLVMRLLVAGKWDDMACRHWKIAQEATYVADASLTTHDGLSQYEQLLAQLQDSIKQVSSSLADLLPRDTKARGPGSLVFNALSFPRRILVAAKGDPAETDGSKVSQSVSTAVSVPSFGYCWANFPAEKAAEKSPPKKSSWWGQLWGQSRSSAEENKIILRTESCQVQIDRTSGAIQGLFPLPYGRNLLGQRLAMRFLQPSGPEQSEDDPEVFYSRMIAETIEPGETEVHARGRLVDASGELVARFTQVTEASPHLPVVRIRIRLEPERMPEANPWNSYYACRFAWSDETMLVRRSLGLAVTETERERFESLYFVQLSGTSHTLTLFTPGLVYHRMIGLRKLDTLLLVRGETTREFTIGIALDVRYPLQAALELLQPTLEIAQDSPPVPASAWFLTLDVQNVIVSGVEPVLTDGQLSELRIVLTETEGRAGPINLQLCRPIQSAHQVDAYGEVLEPLPVNGDQVAMNIGRFQTMFVSVRFASS
jgi:alpha-mannosidase